MKITLTALLIANLISLMSCTPFVTTTIEQSIPQSGTADLIKVFGLDSEIPADAEVLGTVKVGDSGFTATKNCTFYAVLNSAKEEAKKAGGNAIKIIDHIPPGNSTCHRITVKILRLIDLKATMYNEVGSQPYAYAILNIYSEADTLNYDYDLHLNDSIICRVKNNLKTTIAIKKEGLNTLWAQMDNKTVIQINIEFGQSYFLKCNLLSGDAGKQPLLVLVDPKEGSRFFDLFY